MCISFVKELNMNANGEGNAKTRRRRKSSLNVKLNTINHPKDIC